MLGKTAESEIHTMAQLLQALECNLELVRIREGCRIVEHLHSQQRHDRHDGGGAIACGDGLVCKLRLCLWWYFDVPCKILSNTVFFKRVLARVMM